MRLPKVDVVWRRMLIGGLLAMAAVGCGFNPPSAPPPKPDTCTPADAPSAATVQRAITGVPAPQGPWTQTANGHTANCRLYWVQIAPANAQPDSPQQVVFFDKANPLGPATPEPRPYITVLTTGDDTVIVQYQWRQGSDEPCCPTGIATVRFQIGDDGKLKPLDALPSP
jgi:hypothetical protein